MFDLIYKLESWLIDFYTQFPIPVDELGEPAYLLAVHQNTTLIVYLLSTIALLIFLIILFSIFKFIIYSILESIF